MRLLHCLFFLASLVCAGCKPFAKPEPAKNTERPTAQPQVTGNMCERAGGQTGADNTCRCSNGVAAFKLLGQTCAQMLARQTSECSEGGGQILYDDGKCRCYPDYDLLAADKKCTQLYPQSTLGTALTATEEVGPLGACLVRERVSGKVVEPCFDNIDIDGCERSFQVAFQQLKPEFFEMMFFPEKSCSDAKARSAKPGSPSASPDGSQSVSPPK